MNSKGIVITALAILLNLFAIAQDFKIKNESLQVLFAGMHNPIEVEVSGFNCDEYWLEVSNGKIIKDSCDIKLEPSHSGRATLWLKRTVGPDTVLIGKETFRVEPFPEIKAEVGRKSEGTIDQVILRVQPGILAYFSADWQIDVHFEVVHYTAMIIRGDSVILHESANTNRFVGEIATQVRNVQIGDQVFFYNLRAKVPTGEKIRELEPVILTVVERG